MSEAVSTLQGLIYWGVILDLKVSPVYVIWVEKFNAHIHLVRRSRKSADSGRGILKISIRVLEIQIRVLEIKTANQRPNITADNRGQARLFFVALYVFVRW